MRVLDKLSWFRRSYFAGALLLLFLSFAFNIFGVGVNGSWFASFEQGSEEIVKKTAQCKDDQTFYSGPLIARISQNGIPKESDPCSEVALMPYSSQYGLQARTIALFAPDDDSKLDRYFKYTELLVAFISAVIFALFAVKVRRQYGNVTASTLVIFMAISPWIIGYAGNLYWTLPFLIAPFVLTYCIYDKLKIRWHYIIFYVAITILFTLKLLDGYEHITTMVISVLAVVVYYEYQDLRSSIKKLLYPIIFVGVSAITAFSIALLLNVISLNEYYHSFDRSLEVISQRAEARSGTISSVISVQPHVTYALEATLPEVYNVINYYHNLEQMNDGKSNPLLYLAISIMNYALLPAVNLPVEIKGIFGVFIQSVLFISILGYFAIERISHKKKRQLYAATLVGLVGSLSWLVLMPAHAYPHAFLNGIIFYVPFLLFVYIIFGVWFSETLDKRISRRVKK